MVVRGDKRKKKSKKTDAVDRKREKQEAVEAKIGTSGEKENERKNNKRKEEGKEEEMKPRPFASLGKRRVVWEDGTGGGR